MPRLRGRAHSPLAFIPLVSLDRVIGKFMLYYGADRTARRGSQLASVIAAQVAFAVERTRSEEQARRSEERLRFALDAASMGTWDWDLTTNAVQWSDNLARSTACRWLVRRDFASYEREIHPDDRGRVFESVHERCGTVCRTTSSIGSWRPTARCDGVKARDGSSTTAPLPCA